MSENVAFLAHSYGLAHTECWCARCESEAKARLIASDELTPVQALSSFMHLCPDCGNKRCPRATDHRNACTGSNEPGQAGSAYGPYQPMSSAEIERMFAEIDRDAGGIR